MPNSPRVRASGLEELSRLLARHDIELTPLKNRAGLPAGPIDPNDMISLNAYATLLTLASDAVGDPCLGLRLAEDFTPGASGILHYLLRHAATLKDSVDACLRYLGLVIEGIDGRYVESDGIGWLEWHYRPSIDAPRAILTEFALALIVLRLRQATGGHWSPIAVEFEYRKPPCVEEYTRIFGPRLSFNQPVSRIAMAAGILRARLPEADAKLHQILREAADRQLAAYREESDFVSELRHRLVERLPNEAIDLDSVAATFDLQPRQLQWRLSQHQTTFETELNHVRHGLAERYLNDTDESVTTIAFLLGFSEISAFSRAAHRWFGMPPTAYRQRLRQPAGDQN